MRMIFFNIQYRITPSCLTTLTTENLTACTLLDLFWASIRHISTRLAMNFPKDKNVFPWHLCEQNVPPPAFLSARFHVKFSAPRAQSVQKHYTLCFLDAEPGNFCEKRKAPPRFLFKGLDSSPRKSAGRSRAQTRKSVSCTIDTAHSALT
jgi:hypothetical protein